jgi:hypothetical protein
MPVALGRRSAADKQTVLTSSRIAALGPHSQKQTAWQRAEDIVETLARKYGPWHQTPRINNPLAIGYRNARKRSSRYRRFFPIRSRVCATPWFIVTRVLASPRRDGLGFTNIRMKWWRQPGVYLPTGIVFSFGTAMPAPRHPGIRIPHRL